MKKILTLAILAMMAVTVSAKDIKTVVLTTTPQMHCDKCETRIKENLKYIKGIKSIETSVENQSVTVTYDADKTSVEKIKTSLKKANYTATEKTECCGHCKEGEQCKGEHCQGHAASNSSCCEAEKK